MMPQGLLSHLVFVHLGACLDCCRNEMVPGNSRTIFILLLSLYDRISRVASWHGPFVRWAISENDAGRSEKRGQPPDVSGEQELQFVLL